MGIAKIIFMIFLGMVVIVAILFVGMKIALVRSLPSVTPQELPGKIVFGDGTNICVIFPSRGETTKVYSTYRTSRGRVFEPCWSPDGNRIVLSHDEYVDSDEKTSSYRLTLFIMNADGGNLSKFLSIDREDCNFPSWSPDGKKIAFLVWGGNIENPRKKNIPIIELEIGGDYEYGHLYVTDVDNPNPVQVTDLLVCYGDVRPSWSPDSKMLTFTSIDNKGNMKIAVVNIDGTGLRILTDGMSPSWSLLGDRIAYRGKDGFYTIAPDGTKKQKFFSYFEYGRDFIKPLTWSPDGRYILYVRFKKFTIGGAVQFLVRPAIAGRAKSVEIMTIPGAGSIHGISWTK